MRRPICWVEKLDDGIKKEFRVSFSGGHKIRWQAKRSDNEKWEYDFIPTISEWDALLAKAESWHNRRRLPLPDLELVRKAQREAAAS